MVPTNFRAEGESADYIVTGYWGKKAAREAGRFGTANVVFSSEPGGFRTVPDVEILDFSSNAAYVHYVSNETIDGVEFASDLDAGGIPVICDASSDILSRPIDVSKYAMIYAGAQKNIGPSGVTLVIVRDDLLERPAKDVYPIFDYREYAKAGSMPNTPNTWAIYLVSLVCDWLKHQGGTAAMKERNEAKARLLYAAIDGGDGFYRGRAERGARSLMNVTFRLPSTDLDRQFCLEAEARGLDGLAGHRTVGGIRASIYNAFPIEGVEALVGFMADFAERHG
jgi:phosphoserine aminotransferase